LFTGSKVFHHKDIFIGSLVLPGKEFQNNKYLKLLQPYKKTSKPEPNSSLQIPNATGYFINAL
jgi:hypothetical protein